MLVFTGVYIAGIFGQTFSNGNLSALYATRFISGIGIGTTTVLPSIYLTEVSKNYQKAKSNNFNCIVLTTESRSPLEASEV